MMPLECDKAGEGPVPGNADCGPPPTDSAWFRSTLMASSSRSSIRVVAWWPKDPFNGLVRLYWILGFLFAIKIKISTRHNKTTKRTGLEGVKTTTRQTTSVWFLRMPIASSSRSCSGMRRAWAHQPKEEKRKPQKGTKQKQKKREKSENK